MLIKFCRMDLGVLQHGGGGLLVERFDQKNKDPVPSKVNDSIPIDAFGVVIVVVI